MSNQSESLPGKPDSSYAPWLAPSPPSVSEETVHIEGGLLFENEVGSASELGGQDAESLSL